MQELPISNLDKAQLAQYCSFYSDFVKASLILEREDLILEDDKGNQKVNPAFNIRKKRVFDLQQTANTLGILLLIADCVLWFLMKKKMMIHIMEFVSD